MVFSFLTASICTMVLESRNLQWWWRIGGCKLCILFFQLILNLPSITLFGEIGKSVGLFYVLIYFFIQGSTWEMGHGYKINSVSHKNILLNAKDSPKQFHSLLAFAKIDFSNKKPNSSISFTLRNLRVLHRLTNWTVVHLTTFPVNNDLTRWQTMRHYARFA